MAHRACVHGGSRIWADAGQSGRRQSRRRDKQHGRVCMFQACTFGGARGRLARRAGDQDVACLSMHDVGKHEVGRASPAARPGKKGWRSQAWAVQAVHRLFRLLGGQETGRGALIVGSTREATGTWPRRRTYSAVRVPPQRAPGRRRADLGALRGAQETCMSLGWGGLGQGSWPAVPHAAASWSEAGPRHQAGPGWSCRDRGVDGRKHEQHACAVARAVQQRGAGDAHR